MSLLLQSSLAFGTEVTCSNEAGKCKVAETEGMCACVDGMATGWATDWADDEEPQIPEMSEEELMEMCESELAMACPSPSEQCEPDELELCTAILTKMEQFESQCEPPLLDEECEIYEEDKEDVVEKDTDTVEDVEIEDVDDVGDMEKPQSVVDVDGESDSDTSEEDSFFEDLPVYTGPGSWRIVQCCDEFDYDESYRERLECVDALEEGDCTGYEACVPDWGIYCGDDIAEGEDYENDGDKDEEGSVDGGADMDVDQDIDIDDEDDNDDDDGDWERPRDDRPRHDGCPIIDDLPFLGCQAAPAPQNTNASLLTLVLTLADL
jgi:hypothetical protein